MGQPVLINWEQKLIFLATWLLTNALIFNKILWNELIYGISSLKQYDPKGRYGIIYLWLCLRVTLTRGSKANFTKSFAVWTSKRTSLFELQKELRQELHCCQNYLFLFSNGRHKWRGWDVCHPWWCAQCYFLSNLCSAWRITEGKWSDEECFDPFK